MSDRTIPRKRVEYNGVPYKSVTEAKWKIFFDSLGIETYYEVPIRNLRYFPDFYIPTQPCFPKGNLFLEVKPVPNAVEEQPCKVLAGMGCRMGILRDMPWPVTSDLLRNCVQEFILTNRSRRLQYGFCTCPSCGGYGFEFMGRGDRIGCCWHGGDEDGIFTAHDTRILCAYKEALSWKWT